MTITINVRSADAVDLKKVEQLEASLSSDSPIAVALQAILAAAERGVDLALLESDHELTPNQAADMLKMSRPHLVKLMNQGLIGFRMVGSNRRIPVADLLDYIDRHERANAYVSEVLATRERSLNQVKDAAATLTDEDLKSLGVRSR